MVGWADPPSQLSSPQYSDARARWRKRSLREQLTSRAGIGRHGYNPNFSAARANPSMAPSSTRSSMQ